MTCNMQLTLSTKRADQDFSLVAFVVVRSFVSDSLACFRLIVPAGLEDKRKYLYLSYSFVSHSKLELLIFCLYFNCN